METLRRVSRSIQPGTPVSMPWGYAELFMNRRTCLKVSEPFLTFRYEDCQSIVSPTSFPLQVQKSFSKRTRRQDQPQRRVNVFVRRCTSLDTRQMFSLKLPPIINEVNTWPLVAAIPHSPPANVGNSLKHLVLSAGVRAGQIRLGILVAGSAWECTKRRLALRAEETGAPR
jgi:hypothetical protein